MKQVLIAVDQLLNAVCGGWADETISARCWRLRRKPPFRWLRAWIDKIFFWQEGHCKQAFESERRRMQSPPSERL